MDQEDHLNHAGQLVLLEPEEKRKDPGLGLFQLHLGQCSTAVGMGQHQEAGQEGQVYQEYQACQEFQAHQLLRDGQGYLFRLADP